MSGFPVACCHNYPHRPPIPTKLHRMVMSSNEKVKTMTIQREGENPDTIVVRPQDMDGVKVFTSLVDKSPIYIDLEDLPFRRSPFCNSLQSFAALLMVGPGLLLKSSVSLVNPQPSSVAGFGTVTAYISSEGA